MPAAHAKRMYVGKLAAQVLPPTPAVREFELAWLAWQRAHPDEWRHLVSSSTSHAAVHHRRSASLDLPLLAGLERDRRHEPGKRSPHGPSLVHSLRHASAVTLQLTSEPPAVRYPVSAATPAVATSAHTIYGARRVLLPSPEAPAVAEDHALASNRPAATTTVNGKK